MKYLYGLIILILLAVIAALLGRGSGTTASIVLYARLPRLCGCLLAGAALLPAALAVLLLWQLLAASGAREVMTAAALLVVLGTAMLMEKVGLSMAMGAFLAGILLAESNFRHQLEADIEPFRGMLLGLFFMSVGMSIDGSLVKAVWPLLFGATFAAILVKVALVAGLFRLFGSDTVSALRGAAVLAPAG